MMNDLPLWNPDGNGLLGGMEDTAPRLPMWSNNAPSISTDDILVGVGNIYQNPQPSGTHGRTGTRGRTGLTGNPGAVGPTGTSPLGDRGSRGSRGTRGSTGPKGTRGTRGSQRGTRGSRGSTGTKGTSPMGPQGSRGTRGAKDSIIETEIGNISFACVESGRPLFLDILEGRRTLKMRARFRASIVPGSEFVFSVVPSNIGVTITGNTIRVDSRRKVRLIVAGIDRRFPDWEMPTVSDERRIKSDGFWRKAHEPAN